MIHANKNSRFSVQAKVILIAVASSLVFVASPSMADINVTVVDEDGQPVNGFKWVLEQDPTYHSEPGQESSDILAFEFHKSYSPVAQTGETPAGTNTTTISGTDTVSGPYFISVIPFVDDVNGRTYTIGGANANDGDNVTVVAHTGPIPTAQISVLIFEDNAPINGAPDFGAGLGAGPELSERPLTPADGNFSVLIEDAGGRYGISGGQVTLDAFGNPLGTKYQNVGDENFDATDPTYIASLGDGTFAPDANGMVYVENLAPGKYGVQVIPPEGGGWVQTSTIEGSKVIDAWVKANEPTGFVEIGPPGPHVFVGFVRDIDRSAEPAGATVTGQIRNNHLSRPPDFAFFTGNPFPGCYVGLNSGGGIGSAIASQPCDDESGFVIENVPNGDYALAVWDKSLNIVIASLPLTVENGADVNLGDVPVFNWFARLESSVFVDTIDQNGIRDPGEQPMPADSTAVNLRFRDGTVYQSFPVDTEGLAPFDTVFPFFHWLVAEVDFASLKATGATYTVDHGGPVDLIGDNVLNPQPQICTQADIDNGTDCEIDDPLGDSRTLTGEVLTMGIQTFLGQTNRIEFGKAPYTGQENGGISGVIFYATTRAEDDPRFAAGEEWEPGIPRAQVNLYQSDGAGNIVDQDGDGIISPPDIDNPPLGNFPTAGEDVDNGVLGRFDYGDAVQVTWTDSWDDSIPEGCQGEVFTAFPGTPQERATDCYDGIRNFNQMREAVFDGGYAFASSVVRDNDNSPGVPFGNVVYDAGETFGREGDALPTNLYIVESIAPPGYKQVKEEDRNVDFGDEFIPQPNRGFAKAALERSILEKLSDFEIGEDGITVDLTAPAACVGTLREVPALFSFLTFADGVTPLPGVTAGDPDNEAPFATDMRPMCDRKVVALTPGKNAAADFFMFTDVPVAAHVVGGILDDLSNEFDPNSPNFGEKYAPPWLPVVFRDWTGREISRVHADQFGKYNALLPSTYTINQPHPSGVSPNMITACMNDASPMPNPAAATDNNAPELIPDPYRDPRYSQFCYTFQYMPGTITYLDTPVVPVSAFAGKDQFPLDCAVTDDTPEIFSVTSGNNRGPWVNSSANNAGARTLAIRSVGRLDVLNPNFGPNGDPNRTVTRNYRFGGAGQAGDVYLVDAAGNATALQIVSWTQRRINARLSQGYAPGQYQLVVEKSNGARTQVGVTVTVSDGQIDRIRVPVDQPTIQAAIDAAQPGTLITVAPGIYDETVVMYKPVQLQGWGARSTIINGTAAPAERLDGWRQKLIDTQSVGEWDPLPGQEQGLGGGMPETTAFLRDEGAGITVVASNPNPDQGAPGPNVFGATTVAPRIDGFTVTGAVRGGGILVNGYADNLQVSNNRVVSNSGNTGGGVRFGDASLFPDGVAVDAGNNNVVVRDNHIAQNGTLDVAGGGVALFNGTDNYEVSSNFICGNFSQGSGAGIGHFGLSNNGTIRDNKILFNQTFSQGSNEHGGGILIAGIGGTLGLSEGSGSVVIDSNLIQGNHAGSGHGAGIRTQFVNGQDVAARPNRPGRWHQIDIFNNIIVNNVTALSGAGISMQDTARIQVMNNTIANNDSTATAGLAFADANSSNPQPGVGIAAHAHIDDANGTTLIDVIGNNTNANRYRQGISNPLQRNNIVWHNRQFSWQIVQSVDDTVVAEECFEILPNVGPTASPCGTPGNETPIYDDMAVIGNPAATLQPRYTVFSETYDGFGSGNPTNILSNEVDLALASPYVNGDAGQTLIQQELTAGIAAQPALDEGGNFVDVRYGPLTPTGNYHIGLSSSVALDVAQNAPVNNNPELEFDIDGDPRPDGAGPDIGADEANGTFPGVSIAGQAKAGALSGASAGALTTIGGISATSTIANPNSAVNSAVTGVAFDLNADDEFLMEEDEEDDDGITTIEISPVGLGAEQSTSGGESQ